MKIKPLFDRVVVKPEKKEENGKSTFLLPEASQERQQIGVVVAVGDGESIDYNKKEMKVQVGDKVLFSRYAGIDFRDGEENYIVMRQIDIIGVIDD